MKAYRMHSLGNSSLDDVPEPEPAPGEVLVAPEAAGICGTDLHVLHEGVFIDDPETGLPMTMGHEVVGRVVGFGAPVPGAPPLTHGGRALREGDRVVAEPLLNCGTCWHCLRGLPNLCTEWSHLGIRRDGVWAELVTIPARRVTRVPADLPSDHAVLAEPLACALHFLDRAEARPGQSLLILGGGPAGQLTLLAARAMGLGPIVLSDPSTERRRLAEELGADLAVDPTRDDVHEACVKVTGDPGGVDVVIELAGSPDAVSQAFSMPRPGGVLLLAGICGTPSIPVNTNRAVRDEITVRGAFATRWQMSPAIRLLASGALNVGPVLSLKRPWTEAHEGMEDLRRRIDLCKVVLEF